MTSYRILDTSGYRRGTPRATLEPQIKMSCVVNILDAASIYNFCVASMHSLNLLFITGNEPTITGCSAQFLLKFDFLLFRSFGLGPGKQMAVPTSLALHKRFRRRLHPNLHRQLRPEVMDDIQDTTLLCIDLAPTQVRHFKQCVIGGNTRLRQEHCVIPRGGAYADLAASHYRDCVRSKDGRWKLRSSIAVPSHVGMFW